MNSLGPPRRERGFSWEEVSQLAVRFLSILRLHTVPMGRFINNYLIREAVGGAERFLQSSRA